MPEIETHLENNPLWYKDAVIYEVHVRAFSDSNGDGIGDFKGLTSKLNYLEGLGVTAIWLLPFYPSPLRDDGYDIADYLNVHPNYGTRRDFQAFLNAAHKRGIRVITELVVNHTSDQHPWFQKARRAKPGSAARDFYVWSDSKDLYKETRIIFKDFETSNWAWDPLAKAYYWHRFYSHQPDLNYENPEVIKALFQVMDYWLNMGVDGLRLDAVPYLFERDGTNCENLPETHALLKKFRKHVDNKFQNRMLLAEANQWPEDSAAYFGNGDECHMAFHFPLMPRLFMAVQMEDRFPIMDILEQTPSIPERCQWGMFLRNHDELTLEMVTEEEREYMYRAYAPDRRARINLGIRRRLAPLLANDRRAIELMNVLLFTMPGTPIIYYGDEIGMGDNYSLDDRNGVRTPMQWNPDKNAGFSHADPQKLYLPTITNSEYDYKTVNVENQECNAASLLGWMKRLIATRKQSVLFGRGSIEFLLPDNPKVLAYVRQYQDEKILVVVNLSKHPQMVELNLSRFAGCIPEELLSRSRFAPISAASYALTLGGYGYYLFNLQSRTKAVRIGDKRMIPDLGRILNWASLLETKMRLELERQVLPSFIETCRWYGGKARTLQQIQIAERIPVGEKSSLAHLLILECKYSEGLPDCYLLPLSFIPKDKAQRMVKDDSQGIIGRLKVGEQAGFLLDGLYDKTFRRNLLQFIAGKQRVRGEKGDLIGRARRTGRTRRTFNKIDLSNEDGAGESQLLKIEQSNTSVLYGNHLYLKIYRKLAEGKNPETELIRFLSEKRAYSNVPPFAGVIEYQKSGEEPISIGLLQGYVPNQGDAWQYTLDELIRYFKSPTVGTPVQERIGGAYLKMVTLLGKRTGDLHRVLSCETEESAFRPEPFTMLYQQSVFQSMRSLARKSLQLLHKKLKTLPEESRRKAAVLLDREKEILACFRAVLTQNLSGVRIRIHGDYHLGQVLHTGTDFVIIDFEGEPARPFYERRLKRSPLQDVAGMLRSFHYAAQTALDRHVSQKGGDRPTLSASADLWYRVVSGAFLRSYLDTVREVSVGESSLLPNDEKEIEILLNAYLLNKAIYELGYELNNRPDWIGIPLKGIQSILDSNGKGCDA